MVGPHSEGLGAHSQFRFCPCRADWRAGDCASPPRSAERRGMVRPVSDRGSTRGQYRSAAIETNFPIGQHNPPRSPNFAGLLVLEGVAVKRSLS
jgi:hypothetical protein